MLVLVLKRCVMGSSRFAQVLEGLSVWVLRSVQLLRRLLGMGIAFSAGLDWGLGGVVRFVKGLGRALGKVLFS